MNSPTSSHEAASQLAELSKKVEERRDYAGSHARLRDRFEQMYRDEASKATLHDEVNDLGSEDRRKAAVLAWGLSADVKHEGSKLAEAMGLPDTTPETVGDLRWLRDRAKSLADHWSAKAYDARDERSCWQTVASMSKQEMELAAIGNQP